MTEKLELAIRDLWNIDTSLKPVPYGDARERALVEGLHALAAHFGREIGYTFIDARGELDFNLKGAEWGRAGGYGKDLAEVLSMVSRRTGLYATSSPVLPENNWCHLNHFEAERLLKLVGENMYGIVGPDATAADDDEAMEDEGFSPRF